MITKTIQAIKNIGPIIKNKYISHEDLDTIINELDLLLKISIQSKHSMLTEPNYGLDVIFPAINHLQMFLNECDLGSIALVSKTLYNLMIINFTQKQTNVFIAKHYIINENYDYKINVDFIVDEQKLSIPINVKTIFHKKLRLLIGYEKYFETYEKVFFKDDIIYLMNKNKGVTIYYTFVCLFCEKPNCDADEHKSCIINYYNQNSFNYPDFENHLKQFYRANKFNYYDEYKNYICPEKEYLTLGKLKNNIPTKMIETCNKKFDGIGYIPHENKNCGRCKYPYMMHTSYYYSL